MLCGALPVGNCPRFAAMASSSRSVMKLAALSGTIGPCTSQCLVRNAGVSAKENLCLCRDKKPFSSVKSILCTPGD